tara:strand:- start:232 stop:405 length:174 start_codon:yes stop_codon:yes gene_type:complete
MNVNLEGDYLELGIVGLFVIGILELGFWIIISRQIKKMLLENDEEEEEKKWPKEIKI